MSSSISFKDHPHILYGEDAYPIFFGALGLSQTTKIIVLCDENTQEHCVPFFFQQLPHKIDTEIIEIDSGEDHKTIDTCQQLWTVMRELEADRQSVLINIGGGVITDMGGFVASTFLRGIRFINIPTTLLAMVDASIGGKTGVNHGGFKNQIGLFAQATSTLIDIRYLGTLPQNQLNSGLAEMLKHGLIADEDYWRQLSDLSQLSLADLEGLIKKSIGLKLNIVNRDQRESGLRKVLNFGHTLGHAIESFCLESNQHPTLLHGEAVAIGMILEGYLSTVHCSLTQKEAESIKAVIHSTFQKSKFTEKDIDAILSNLKYDKKTTAGQINFVLLKRIGQPEINCAVSTENIRKAFDFYTV